jgi:hypothetical protein
MITEAGLRLQRSCRIWRTWYLDRRGILECSFCTYPVARKCVPKSEP